MLATALGGDAGALDPADVHEPGVDGFVLHPPDSTSALEAALRRVLDDTEAHQRAADDLAVGIVEAYDWDAAAERLEAVYLDALDGAGRRRADR